MRALARAVLAVAAVASMFWAALSTQQLPAVARLCVMAAVIAGAVLGAAALQPKGDDRHGR